MREIKHRLYKNIQALDTVISLIEKGDTTKAINKLSGIRITRMPKNISDTISSLSWAIEEAA